MSLVARLVVLVLLAVLPVAAVVVWNEAQLGRERETAAEQEALRLARFVDGELQRLVESGRGLLTAVAASPAVRNGDAQACEAVGADILEELPQFFGFGAVGLDGRFFCSWSRSNTGGRGLAAAGWWRTAVDRGDFVVNGYLEGGWSGRKLLLMSRPFEARAGGGGGSVGGVVSLTVDLDWLNAYFGARELPAGATIGITDANGIFLVRQPAGAQKPGDPGRQRWILEREQAGTVSGIGPDGVERIVGYLPPRATQSGAFIVSVGLARAPLVAALDARTAGTLAMFVAALGVSLLVMLLGGRMLIGHPVEALATAAERWRAGDLAARTGLAGGGHELGRLAQAFDAMAQSVESRERALRESDARFRGAIEGADVPIMMHAEDGELLAVSRGLLTAIGYARGELNDFATWAELAYRDEAPRVLERIARRFAEGEPIPAIEKTIHTKDGRRLTWVWYAASPERLADGRRYLVAIAADVTARKAAEAESERARAFAQRLADASPSILYVYDLLADRNVYANQGVARLLGYTAEEVRALPSIGALIHPDDLPRLPSPARRMQLADADIWVETRYRMRHKDGRWRWLQGREAPFAQDPDGSVTQVIGSATDITALKDTEEALRLSRERLQLAILAADIALWDWDVVTGEVRWEGAHERIYGMPEAELGRYGDAMRLVPADDLARITTGLDAAQANGSASFEAEFRLLHPDGRLRWLLSRSILHRDPAGKVVRASGADFDITGRKRAEEALRQSRERLDLALSAGGMGLWDWDMTTGELFWDEGQRRLYGLGADDPVSVESFTLAVHPEDREAGFEREAAAIAAGAASLEGEFRIIRPDGELRWIFARTALTRDAEGRVVRQSGVNMDITERRRAVDAVEAANRRVRDILESTTDGFIGIDRDWRFTYFNRAAEAANRNVPRSEVLGRSVWEVWPMLLGTVVEETYRQVMRARQPRSFEYRHADDERGELWFDIQVFPTQDGLGVFFRDIGERKRFERELARLVAEVERERTRFQGIVDSSPAGIIFAQAPHGQIVYANPQVQEILRGPATLSVDVADYAAYTGRHADGRTVRPEEWPLARALGGETVKGDELLIRRGDGSEAWVRASAAPLRDGSGAVVVFQDVDAEKRAQEALRESEERLRLAVEAGRLGMFYVAPRRRLVIWDEGERQLFGLGDREAPATLPAFLALVHPDDREAVRASIAGSLATGGDFRREYRLATRDGRLQWIAERGTVRKDEHGRIVAITGINWDVTERRIAQERQELLMRELDHRVKNMLAVTQVIAQQSGRGATDLNEFQAAFAGRIRAMATAHEMLAASQWVGAELGALARSTLAHWLDASPAPIRLELQDVLLAPQIAQNLALVLHELATNAVKHGALSVPGGGVLLQGEIDGHDRLVLTWSESGGPPVTAPRRKGFGSTLLQRAMAYPDQGEVSIDWNPQGLVWRAVLPLARR